MAAARRIVLSIWSLCFLAGAFNHARALIGGGWHAYDFAPPLLAMFWTALLPIDLVVVALLWTHRAAGVWLGLAVMIADVGANSWFACSCAFRSAHHRAPATDAFSGLHDRIGSVVVDGSGPGRV